MRPKTSTIAEINAIAALGFGCFGLAGGAASLMKDGPGMVFWPAVVMLFAVAMLVYNIVACRAAFKHEQIDEAARSARAVLPFQQRRRL